MSKYRATKTANFKEESKKNKIKPVKEENENTLEVKRFICILVIIIALIIGLYFLSKTGNNDKELTNTNIQYNNISVGMILNRNYDDYYVLVYDFNDSQYNTLVTNYRKNGEKKLFTIDMNDKINESFISSSTSNKTATQVNDFMFGETTLLHIVSNKVSKYITGDKNISKILK